MACFICSCLAAQDTAAYKTPAGWGTSTKTSDRQSGGGLMYFALSYLKPTGSFADAEADYSGHRLRWGLMNKYDKGGAGWGLGVHMGVWFRPPAFKHAHFGYDIALTWCWMNSDIKDYYRRVDDDMSDYYNSDFKTSLPHYFLAPFTFGSMLRFGKFNVSGGLGFSMNMVGNFTEEWREKGKDKEEWIHYEVNMFSFAWRVGIGVELSETCMLMLNYYSLGTLKIKGNSSSSSGSAMTDLDKIHPTMFSATLAYSIKNN